MAASTAQGILEQRAVDFGFSLSIARRVAQFAYIVAGEATDGSRRRVRSKLTEILDRLEANA